MFQIKYQIVGHKNTGLRPKTSLNGPSTMGPKAKASTNMDKVDCVPASSISKSRLIYGRAGASIVELMRVTRLKTETSSVQVHFRAADQLIGFVGSSDPSHVTWKIISERAVKTLGYEGVIDILM